MMTETAGSIPVFPNSAYTIGNVFEDDDWNCDGVTGATDTEEMRPTCTVTMDTDRHVFARLPEPPSPSPS